MWYEGADTQEIVWAVSCDRGLTWGPHRTLVLPASDLPVWAPVLHVQARLLFYQTPLSLGCHCLHSAALSTALRQLLWAAAWMQPLSMTAALPHCSCVVTAWLRALLSSSESSSSMIDDIAARPDMLCTMYLGKPDVPVLLCEPQGLLESWRGRAHVVSWWRHLHAGLRKLGGDLGEAAGALVCSDYD